MTTNPIFVSGNHCQFEWSGNTLRTSIVFVGSFKYVLKNCRRRVNLLEHLIYC